LERTQVVVIGGGATGTGILRDLALRGVPAVLFEQKDLAFGTSGRFHGLLHSGGRYAVKDGDAARECIEENTILKKVASCCIEDTGGMFVQLDRDDPDYVESWLRACKQVGIPAAELSRREALEMEPNLSPSLKRAFKVPDACIDGFLLTLANAQSAVEMGAAVKTYTRVTKIAVDSDKVQGVHYRDEISGDEGFLGCELVINAGGPWAGEVASSAGTNIRVNCDRGALIIFNHRLTSHVVNHCRVPGDADILVPAGPVSILGTTSVAVDDPWDLRVGAGEVEYIVSLGAEMVPSVTEARIMRAFAGIRPLYSAEPNGDTGGREISRGFALIDQQELDGTEGLISVVGGKLTTYRLMAQVTTNLACRKLGVAKLCTTDRVPLKVLPQDSALAEAKKVLSHPVAMSTYRRLGPGLAAVVEKVKNDPAQAEIICECELITRAELETYLSGTARVPARTLNDLSRRTRLGMGPCQGTFCGYRAMLVGYETGKWTADEAGEQLVSFVKNRWKGQKFVPYGKQTQQLGISRDLYGASLNLIEPGNGVEK